MAKIKELLQKILSARYGKDVRQAIYDAIKQCYEDGKAGSVDLTAREEIGVIEELTTGVKDTIVKAINWLNNSLSTLSNSLVALAQRVSKNETDISKINSDFNKRIKQGSVFTGIDTPFVNNSKARLYLGNDGNLYIYTANRDTDDAWTLNSDISVNTRGDGITLKGKTESSPYTCTSDGYILCNVNTANHYCTVSVLDANGTALTNITSIGSSLCMVGNSLFVKKGMKLYASYDSPGNVSCYFIPLK